MTACSLGDQRWTRSVGVYSVVAAGVHVDADLGEPGHVLHQVVANRLGDLVAYGDG